MSNTSEDSFQKERSAPAPPAVHFGKPASEATCRI